MQKSLFSSLLLASVSASLTAHAANNDEINNLPETLVTATRSDSANMQHFATLQSPSWGIS
jgi:nucleoside-specific outer membrane channel protein Tsx